MKILKKNVMMFLICTALPVSSGMILYSSDIKSVIIRNNRVKISLEKAKKLPLSILKYTPALQN